MWAQRTATLDLAFFATSAAVLSKRRSDWIGSEMNEDAVDAAVQHEGHRLGRSPAYTLMTAGISRSTPQRAPSAGEAVVEKE